MIENNIIVVRFRAKEVYGIVELLWNVKLIFEVLAMKLGVFMFLHGSKQFLLR